MSYATSQPSLMPLPAEITQSKGRFVLGEDFTTAFTGKADPRLHDALVRTLVRWEERTGYVFTRDVDGSYTEVDSGKEASLIIHCDEIAPEIPVLGTDESYEIEVTNDLLKIDAKTTIGVLHGLETLLQLLQSDENGWFIPALEVKDQPRFKWRGLLIDVCRHWQPMEVIKRNLDGMALVKLNVLHLHLTEDQGFRVECKQHPKLHEMGSDGNYFSHEDIKEIVAYAAERGIRVVPEFDIPGHATSWVVGYPELASAPGPYVIERTWGVFDPTLDPTREDVYEFLDDVFEEMAMLFPDPYFHIGGDENNGNQWNKNEDIQAFMKKNELEDNHALQAYFNRRLKDILLKHGKIMVGWDEILHPDIPSSAIIQSWRGAEGLAKATKAGHQVILSNGYYIDLIQPASDHYLNDPIPEDSNLSEEEQALVLGGEATMWAEWVTPETIDSRIWPRTAAIAERLWSAQHVRDVEDMYCRLETVSQRLSEVGLLHESNSSMMIKRYAGDQVTPAALVALHALVEHIEPVKGYERNRLQPGRQHGAKTGTQYLALTGLADCARPDSKPSRLFAQVVDAFIDGEKNESRLVGIFTEWSSISENVRSQLNAFGAKSKELKALAGQLHELATIGQEILAAETISESAYESFSKRIKAATQPVVAAELPMAKSMQLLLVAVREKEHRAAYSGGVWSEHINEIAFPKKG